MRSRASSGGCRPTRRHWRASAEVERRRRARASSESAGFRILPSRAGRVTTSIPPDTATCDDCLRELFDPADRRYRYAFINCTQCGPRYTLTRTLPYDRAQTSMARVRAVPAMPARIHRPAAPALPRRAQRLPGLRADARARRCARRRAAGRPDRGHAGAAARRRASSPSRASAASTSPATPRNADAVARLRERKQREEKPFAVMAANLASAAALGARRRRRAGAAAVARAADRAAADARRRASSGFAGVAPGLRHARRDAALHADPVPAVPRSRRPSGRHRAGCDDRQDLLLVMTSANPGGEPLVIGNDEALTRLARHRRRAADARPRHRRPLRRQRAAPRRRRRARSSSAARAATRRRRSSCRAPARRCSPPAPG